MEDTTLTPRLTRSGIAAFLLLAGAPLLAQHPNVARGFTPSGMFDVGGIDMVNGFNGNLSIRIPIGIKYPVGGQMGSYSFSLTYNGNVWNHVSRVGVSASGDSATSVYTVPNPFAEGGLGWSFSLGRIGDMERGQMSNGWTLDPPAPRGKTTFHSADGAEHVLFPGKSMPVGFPAPVEAGYWFTDDGSHLRYDSVNRVLELPDGTRETFDETGRPSSFRDRFGNGFSVTYEHGFPSAPDIPSRWTIDDGKRTHHVNFRLTGYEWPFQRAVIDSIQLARFADNGFATYRFLYNGENENGSGFQDVAMTGFGTQLHINNEPPWRPKVFVLTRLILPDGTSYRMPLPNYVHNNSPCNGPNDCEGPIGRLVFPTGGAMEWDYQLRTMPVPRLNEERKWLTPAWSFSVHVSRRRLYDERGLVGEWKYGSPDADLGIDLRWNEIVRQITQPPAEPGRASDRVLTYYSACVDGICINEAGAPDGQNNTYATEYGLPFSRRRPSDGGEPARFLSQEIYPAGSTVPVRRVYVRYENDLPPGFSSDTTFSGIPVINQRQQSQRTVFLDDLLPANKGHAWVTVEHSEYDGLGHYRRTTTTDNFGFGTARTERTDWNPNGRPLAPQPWLLNLFTFQEQQEGSSLARQEFLFDSNTTGFLRCKRILKDGRSRGAFDVLVSYEHTNPNLPGSVTLEKWYGGDNQNISGKGCESLPAAAAYEYDHDYTAGALSKTTVQAGTTLNVLDLDIHGPSGLVLASRDVSGRATDYSYDSMGRLTNSSAPGEAETRIDYLIQGLPSAAVVVNLTVGPLASPLEQRKTTLDGLGRTIKAEVRMPGGGWGASVAAYNALGWKLFESNRESNPAVPSLATRCTAAGKGTAYCNYDAFGRPGLVMTADGKTTLLEYQGQRVVKRTRRVWDGSKEVLGTTREEYDGLGRLRAIREPNGTLTRYGYDVGGRLATVTAKTQSRTFKFDGRGFLFREVQPESGTVIYRYDAWGNVTRKITPTGTIVYEYDTAGRLIQVSTPQTPLRILSYVPSGAAAGKLEQARA
jgi:YD repeat-containing protein